MISNSIEVAQLLSSITVVSYTPALSPDKSSVVYGGVPPLIVNSAEPSLNPLQETLNGAYRCQ